MTYTPEGYIINTESEMMKMQECCRKRERTDGEYKKLANRLNRIEGQVRGIRKMLEESAYCVDILTQVAAAKAALDSFTKELLTEHISTCVADDLKSGSTEKAEELAEIVKKLMR